MIAQLIILGLALFFTIIYINNKVNKIIDEIILGRTESTFVNTVVITLWVFFYYLTHQ